MTLLHFNFELLAAGALRQRRERGLYGKLLAEFIISARMAVRLIAALFVAPLKGGANRKVEENF